jgi:hypothetical protein
MASQDYNDPQTMPRPQDATDVTDQAQFTSYDGIMQPTDGIDQNAPIYRVIGESKIPVSKFRGPLWQSRYQQGLSAMQKNVDAWDEAYRYYRHDHTRSDTRSGSEDQHPEGTPLHGPLQSTENIVFANVSSMVPMLFTKNPDAEFTVEDEADKPLARVLEKLVNTLASKKTAPGLNLKRKVKRNIVSTVLTNIGWFEVGYTLREQSSEAAMAEVEKLSIELEKAKSQKDIKECEGKLLALELTIDVLTPSGPWVKVRRPNQIIIDTAATDLDLSGDCNWVLCEDLISTAYIRARYGRKKPDSDEWESVFAPTHVIKAGISPDQGERGQTDNFQLFSYSTAEHTKYGYTDQRAFLSAQMTKCVYVWDRVTRRVELYNANDWCYPLWVWDDPYHLDQFYPFVPMDFHTDPMTMYAKGEVTYYLDQQDDINVINNEWAKIRKFATGKVVFDKNAFKDSSLIEELITGTTSTNAIGIDLPEGKKIGDVIAPLLPPSAEVMKFFDKKPVIEAIDRLSGVAAVQRGVEYKTNTTNRAIESYESQVQTRADEKMDAIEESVGLVLWLTAQLCLQNMEQQEVQIILGDKFAKDWKKMTSDEIRTTIVPRVVGGSTLKPTSRAKKEQAMQIAQVIGQFTKATPMAIVVALKVMAQAFDNVLISQEDWEMIYKGVMQSIQAEQAANAPQQGQAPPPSGGPPQRAGAAAGPRAAAGAQGNPQAGGGGNPLEKVADAAKGFTVDEIQQLVQQVSGIIDRLPPPIKQHLGVQLARGKSVADIATEMIAQMQHSAAA